MLAPWRAHTRSQIQRKRPHSAIVRFARIQVLVQGLVPGGAAETSAVVNVGDEIISINNVLVRDLGLGIHAQTILACDSLTFSFDVCCWQDPFMDRAHRAVKTAVPIAVRVCAGDTLRRAQIQGTLSRCCWVTKIRWWS